MNIVMPMAGHGSRFAEAGFKDPKPLIPVFGRPMYTWAMDSLPLHLAEQVIFICQQAHLDDLRLKDDIETRYGHLNPVVIGLSEVTEGQACTVLCAKEYINDNSGLLIYNADTFMKSSIGDAIQGSENLSGIFSVFEAEGDHWSFAKIDASGRITETAEKKRISDLASTGLYYFSRGCDFVSYTEKMIQENRRTGGEFYVAPVYNDMIADGAHFTINLADEVWGIGKPDELDYFLKNYPISSSGIASS